MFGTGEVENFRGFEFFNFLKRKIKFKRKFSFLIQFSGVDGENRNVTELYLVGVSFEKLTSDG